jgi:protein-tyrosine-phosphatase
MGNKLIVFVCTGNICRSPMAEYMLRARMKESSDWKIASAGLAACPGLPASAAAVHVLARDGIDLSSHRSRALDRSLVDAADVLVVMTAAHSDQIRMLFPQAMGQVFLLTSFCEHGGDVPDPIGSSVDAYVRTRDLIDRALPDLVSFLEALHIN